MIELTTTQQALLLTGSFLFFTLLEGIIPLLRMRYKKIRHAGINFLFIFLSILVTIPFAFLAIHSSDWVKKHDFGLLNLFELPSWLYILLGIIMLDFFSGYIPHLVQHKVQWMWNFHLVHHTDNWVDTSTANRHHPGETIISLLFLIAAIFITGAPAWLVLLNQFIAAAFSQFVHANISLPRRIDYLVSLIFISPNMHKVHHHHRQPLTDTNYGSIFSVWDRILNTFAKSEISELRYGIDTYPHEEEHNNMGKLLVIPFEEYRPPTTEKSRKIKERMPEIKIIHTPIPSRL